MKILLTDKQKKVSEISISKESIAIGRVDNNDIVLSDARVSRNHAIILEEEGNTFIKDLDSANGIYLNEKKVQDKQVVNPGDKIKIEGFMLEISDNNVADIEEPKGATKVIDRSDAGKTRSVIMKESNEQEIVELKTYLHERLIKRLDLKRLDFRKTSEKEVRNKVTSAVAEVLSEHDNNIPEWMDKRVLTKEIIDEALGLGPLEDLLADNEVTEIMVNNVRQIFIEKNGKITLSNKKFVNEKQLLAVIERIVAPIGRRIDESSPMVDGRLKDGSRVNAIIPPLALKGPSLTIRKFSTNPYTVDDLIGFGSLNKDIAAFLEICVLSRKNVIISGGTGSGKTTLLNVLSSFIPDSERIITIEDSAELKLNQIHIVSLESRPPNIEGKGAILIRDLVKNSLRMRPDRIVIGECRGGEALDMLQAMNTGHDGSLTTVHANSPKDALSRLETLVLMAGMDLPSRAIREQIASAINIIVQQSRLGGGSRKITYVSEVKDIENGTVMSEDIFRFEQTGIDDNNKVLGNFVPTGYIPSFVNDLEKSGINIDKNIFNKKK